MACEKKIKLKFWKRGGEQLHSNCSLRFRWYMNFVTVK